MECHKKTEAHMYCENTSVEVSTKRTNWAKKNIEIGCKIHSNVVSTKNRDWVKKTQMGCKNTLIWALSKKTDWGGTRIPQIGCMNILRWVTKIK